MEPLSSSSEDESSHRSLRFEDDYCVSADVSESESDGGDNSPVASTSLSTPPSAGHPFTTFLNLVPSPIKPPVAGAKYVGNTEKADDKTELSEVQLMKDRFSKLLLGEDMSGRGNGVCTALAMSNAITKLSATVFGDLWKLEPLTPQRKSMWRREIEWLISVSDPIVELIPSVQQFPDGGTFEIMVTRPRSDLYVNLPALRKLDAMLVSMLDGFKESEFYYVERGLVVSDRSRNTQGVGNMSSSPSDSPSVQYEEKWWLPFPKVPPNGLTETTVRRLQQCRECSFQIFKAAAAINSNVLSEMEVPKAYLESLPKSAKACLGETLHQYITAKQFSPEGLLDYLEMSSECTTFEIANRIESAMHIWRQRHSKGHGNSGRSLWSGTGDKERNKLLSERANTLLKNLKLQFLGLPQTTLDLDKIKCNRDVGQSILESYSRVIESLAFNLMARIDDLLYVDDATKRRAVAAAGLAASLHLQRPTMPGYHHYHSFSSSSMLTAPVFSSSPRPIRKPERRAHSSSPESLRDALSEALERLTFN